MSTPIFDVNVEKQSMQAEIDRLRAALRRIDGINDNPACYNADIEAALREALGD